MDDTAYKILTAPQFSALLKGQFGGAPVDISDGYIHLSSAAQLTGTAQKHFAGQDGLFVLAIGLARLGNAVRWEVSRGGDLFPHLYGRLGMEHVLAHAPLCWKDGEVVLPA